MHNEEPKGRDHLVLVGYVGSKRRRLRIISTVTVLMLLVAVSISYVFYKDIDEIRKKEISYINNTKEMQWSHIKSIIIENNQKATISSTRIKMEIENMIFDAYGADLANILVDLSNIDEQSSLSQIINTGIQDRYLNNIKNDYNGVFVAFRWGIYADKSLSNSSLTDSIRTWDVVRQNHYNPVLAEQAISAILDQTGNDIIFWEPRDVCSKEHKKIDAMTESALKEVFFLEGIEGLKGYEFLRPSYIRDDEDILGNPDVSNLGQRQDNYKIIVVQRFNIYDIITNNHYSLLNEYDKHINIVRLSVQDELLLKEISLVLILIIVLASFIALITLYNNIEDDVYIVGGDKLEK